MLQDRVPYHGNEYSDDNDISDDRPCLVRLERNVVTKYRKKVSTRRYLLKCTENHILDIAHIPILMQEMPHHDNHFIIISKRDGRYVTSFVLEIIVQHNASLRDGENGCYVYAYTRSEYLLYALILTYFLMFQQVYSCTTAKKEESKQLLPTCTRYATENQSYRIVLLYISNLIKLFFRSLLSLFSPLALPQS